MTQSQLAEALEISTTYLKQLEYGNRKLTEDLKYRLKFIANIDPARWTEDRRYPMVGLFQKFSKKTYSEYRNHLSNLPEFQRQNISRDLETRLRWLFEFGKRLYDNENWAKLAMFDYELNLVLKKTRRWNLTPKLSSPNDTPASRPKVRPQSSPEKPGPQADADFLPGMHDASQNKRTSVSRSA